MSSLDFDEPTEWVGFDAPLDGSVMVVEVLEDGTASLARSNLDDLVATDDFIHGRDDDGGAAGGDFLEGGQFIKGDGAHFNLHAQMGSQRAEAIVGDAGQNGVGERRNIRALGVDAQEVGGAELVDILVFDGVEVEVNGEAFVVADLVRKKGCAVVATHLDSACAVRSRAIEVIHHQSADGLEAAFVVGADGHHQDDEGVFIGLIHANLRASADEQGTDIHGGTCAIRRNKLDVGLHDATEGIHEKLFRDGGHAAALGASVEAACILQGAERLDFPVFRLIDLQTFKGILPIVEGGGGHVNLQIGFFYQFACVPCAVAPGVADVAVHIHVGKSEL